MYGQAGRRSIQGGGLHATVNSGDVDNADTRQRHKQDECVGTDLVKSVGARGAEFAE